MEAATFAASDGPVRWPIMSTISPTHGKARRPYCCCTLRWAGARRYFAWVPPSGRGIITSVRLDLRGPWGLPGAAGPTPPLTLDRLVLDARPSCSTIFGVGEAHVVGNSAGGYLGQQLAMTPGPRRGQEPLPVRLDPRPEEQSGAQAGSPQIQAQGACARLPRRDDPRPPAGRCRSRSRHLVSG